MIVIPAVIHFQLLCEILKGIKRVGGIEAFVVLTVASFHLPIMSGSKRPYDLVPDAVPLQMNLEHRGLIPISSKAVGEFRTVVCLDALNRAGKGFYQMFQEHGGRISIVFFKSLHKTPSGKLVNGCVLEELLSNDPAVFEAG